MSDQTPSVPELWWSPKFGVVDRRTRVLLGELPSDAVKLVPETEVSATVAEVREVEEERNEQERRALAAEASLEDLKRKILEATADVGEDDIGTAYDAVDRIRAIVEGENR